MKFYFFQCSTFKKYIMWKQSQCVLHLYFWPVSKTKKKEIKIHQKFEFKIRSFFSLEGFMFFSTQNLVHFGKKLYISITESNSCKENRMFTESQKSNTF